MKRIIGVLLALLLVITGFGNINYVQSDTINEVHVNFVTEWGYQVQDSFINGPVDGRLQVFDAAINNSPDGTGDIIGLQLSLATDVDHFDEINPEPVQVSPPQWSFGDLPEGNRVNARVALYSDEFPVNFEPGFNAARWADRTMFSGDGWQNITITVMPKESMGSFGVHVGAREDDFVYPSIDSWTGGDWGNISPDGHELTIIQNSPVVDALYIFTVKIWVVPKVNVVDFMPAVDPWTSESINSGDSYENPFSQIINPVGEWTLSAQGSYHWNWEEVKRKIVNIQGHSYETFNDVFLGFHNIYNYSPSTDTFINSEVLGQRLWGTGLNNRLNYPASSIDATVQLDTEIEFQNLNRDNLDFEGPPTYQWSYSGIQPGNGVNTFVSYEPNDPSPVSFWPGFNAYRSVDVTSFDEPGYQTLTIKVTPQQMASPWFSIGVNTPDNTPSSIVFIDSCEGASHYNISPDGHRLNIWEPNPNYGIEYIYIVKVWVEPGIFPVELWPYVEIQSQLSNTIEYVGEYDSYSKDIPGIGEWTWNTSGVYPVTVAEQVAGCIHWEAHFEELSNDVFALFQTFWTFMSPGDEFVNNGNVPGNISRVSQILNGPDNTGDPVSNVILDLDTSLAFDQVIPPVPGPDYHWSYGNIPEGNIRGATVSFLPDPVQFTPGFDASCTANQTIFSQPGTQILRINVTPRQSGAGELGMELLVIDIFAMEDENVIPTIISVEGADGLFLNQDGHRLMMLKENPVVGAEYPFTVNIEVIPQAPQVCYQPTVRIYTPCFDAVGSANGDSVEYDMPGVGKWTWTADGNYEWGWLEGTAKAVVFPRDSRVVITEFSIEHMSVDFDNRRPNMDRIAISEATINLGETATYDLSVDDVVVNVDGVVITIPAGSFIKQDNNECYHYESTSGAEPQINMELDFEKGEWRIKVSKIDAGAIDNSDGVEITLTIGTLSATEVIDMQVGGLTFIADQ